MVAGGKKTQLEGDGFFRPGSLAPDIDVSKLDALAEEEHNLLASRDRRAAGRTLTLHVEPVSGRVALWMGAAGLAAIVAVFWPWAALGVVGCLLLAALAPRGALRRSGCSTTLS